MPARRPRRARLLVFVVFAVIVVLLYSNSSSDTIDEYKLYLKDKAEAVGGGAVLRPKPEDEEGPRPPPPPPQRPIEELEKPKPLIPAKSSTAPEKAVKTTTSAPHSAKPIQTPEPVVPWHPPEDDFLHQEGKGRVEVSIPAQHSTTVHWSSVPQHFPIASTIPLPTGSPKAFPKIQREINKLSMHGADEEKLAIIKATTKRSWKGYRDNAFGQDELAPMSGAAKNPFNGWGATLVDALDTLWVMGLKEDFEEAVEQVGKIDFTTSPRSDIPLFETVIRYLGGLVAAYDVSGKKHGVLLDKAVELAEVLYTAFDTPNRVPMTYFWWKPAFTSQPHRASSRAVLAEIGTLSLEFTRLAQLTGEPKYYDAIARITDLFETWQNNTRVPGLWPTAIDASGCGRPTQVQGSETTRQQANLAPDGGLLPDGGLRKSQIPPGVQVTREELDMDPDERFRPGAHGPPPPIQVGKIKGWDEPIEESKVDTKAADRAQPQVGKIRGWGNPIDEGGEDRSAEQPDPAQPALSKIKDWDTSDSNNKQKRSPPVQPAPVGANVDDTCVPQGLTSVSKNTAESFTLSGASDSMYEYLPKEYMLLGGLVEKYKTMYLDSAAAWIENVIFKPMTVDERDILLTGDLRLTPNFTMSTEEERTYISKLRPELAHLACFAGGMFAMGGVIFDKPEHVSIGAKLTDGCVWAYNSTTTGIMPEGADLLPCPDPWGECKWDEAKYWRVLDPYEETRTRVDLPPVAAPTRTPNADGAVAGSPVWATKNSGPFKVTKRQLHDDVVPAAAKPDPPTNRIVAHPPPDAVIQDHSSSSAAPEPPAEPIYTPPPPLSHEEFVRKKIADERLPPSYTAITSRKYILRPEAIESVFYMYRITGDIYWREAGWQMFLAVDRNTRALYGASAMDDVTKAAPEAMDQMESFWLAETLKYFYLLFDEPGRWSLDEWVLNTEAHLFRRPQ